MQSRIDEEQWERIDQDLTNDYNHFSRESGDTLGLQVLRGQLPRYFTLLAIAYLEEKIANSDFTSDTEKNETEKLFMELKEKKIISDNIFNINNNFTRAIKNNKELSDKYKQIKNAPIQTITPEDIASFITNLKNSRDQIKTSIQDEINTYLSTQVRNNEEMLRKGQEKQEKHQTTELQNKTPEEIEIERLFYLKQTTETIQTLKTELSKKEKTSKEMEPLIQAVSKFEIIKSHLEKKISWKEVEKNLSNLSTDLKNILQFQGLDELSRSVFSLNLQPEEKTFTKPTIRRDKPQTQFVMGSRPNKQPTLKNETNEGPSPIMDMNELQKKYDDYLNNVNREIEELKNRKSLPDVKRSLSILESTKSYLQGEMDRKDFEGFIKDRKNENFPDYAYPLSNKHISTMEDILNLNIEMLPEFAKTQNQTNNQPLQDDTSKKLLERIDTSVQILTGKYDSKDVFKKIEHKKFGNEIAVLNAAKEYIEQGSKVKVGFEKVLKDKDQGLNSWKNGPETKQLIEDVKTYMDNKKGENLETKITTKITRKR